MNRIHKSGENEENQNWNFKNVVIIDRLFKPYTFKILNVGWIQVEFNSINPKAHVNPYFRSLN